MKNLIKAINTRLVSDASYALNVCDFNQKQIDNPDKLTKKALRKKECMVDKLVMKDCIFR